MLLNQFITLSVFPTYLLSVFQLKLCLYFVICAYSADFIFFAGFSNLVDGRFEKFFIEKEILAQMFSCEFCKIFKKIYFLECLHS